jgi:CSLREA domain-containing protein
MRRVRRWAGALVLGGGALWALTACGTEARTFVVDTTVDAVDANPGDGVCQSAAGACSLRAAVMEANTWAQPDGETIVLQASATYPLTLTGAAEDAARSGDLDLAGPLHLQGTGATIDATGTGERVVQVTGGSVDVANVTLQGGQADVGAGILTGSGTTTTLTGVTVTGNAASGRGGGVDAAQSGGVGATVSIAGSTISSNTATQGGGGVLVEANGSLTVGSTTFADNVACPTTCSGQSWGGGIYSESPVALTASTFAGNDTPNGSGSAVYVAQTSLELRNSTVTGGTTFDGSVRTWDGVTSTLEHVTISGNAGVTSGFHAGPGAVATITSSIIGGQVSGTDCGGGFTSSTAQRVVGTSPGSRRPPTARTRTPSSPAAVKGPTATMKPAADSPAADLVPAGRAAAPRSPPTSAAWRPQRHGCDAGSVEFTAAEAQPSTCDIASIGVGSQRQGCDLSHADLSGRDMTGADFTGADLSQLIAVGANFTGVNLTGANLAPSDVHASNFSGANLTDAQFGSSDLTGSDLTGATLTRTDLSFAGPLGTVTGLASTVSTWQGVRMPSSCFSMAGYSFAGVDLTDAVLAGCTFTGADFTGAILTRTDLHNSVGWASVTGLLSTKSTWQGTNFTAANGLDLTGVDLSHLNLTGSRFDAVSLRNADLSHSDLHGVVGLNSPGTALAATTVPTAWTGTDFTGTGVSFTGKSFTGFDLSGTVLNGANLTGATFTGATVTGMDVSGARIGNSRWLSGVVGIGSVVGFEATYPDWGGARFTGSGLSLAGKDLTGKNFTGVRFEGADLSGATLTNAEFSGAILQQANLSNVIGINSALHLAPQLSSYWSGTNFSGSGLDVTGMDLSGREFVGTNFTGVVGGPAANTQYVLWTNATCPDGTNAATHANTCVGYGF